LTAIELVIAKEVEQLLKDEDLLKDVGLPEEENVEIFLPVLLR